MGESNLETRVAVLETDIRYLKDGHSEMKATIKELSSLPRVIDKIDGKLDTVISQQQELKTDVKDEIGSIEERLDSVENKPSLSSVKPERFLGLDFDKAVKIIYLGFFIGCIILGILAAINGVDPSKVMK